MDTSKKVRVERKDFLSGKPWSQCSKEFQSRYSQYVELPESSFDLAKDMSQIIQKRRLY